jgi:hypothetical protein
MAANPLDGSVPLAEKPVKCDILSKDGRLFISLAALLILIRGVLSDN